MEQLWSRLAALRARVDASRLGLLWRRESRRLSHLWRRGVDPVRPAVDAASSAVRRVETAVRPGTPPILYTDGMVTLDHHGIVVSAYYMPFGRRRIPYARIRGVGEYPLTWGRAFRVHGFAWPRHWFHRDSRRGERAVGLELVTDDVLHPILTPVDVDAVREILDRQLAIHRPVGQPPPG